MRNKIGLKIGVGLKWVYPLSFWVCPRMSEPWVKKVKIRLFEKNILL